MEDGDFVKEVDGKPIESWQEFAEIIQNSPGNSLSNLKWIVTVICDVSGCIPNTLVKAEQNTDKSVSSTQAQW